MLKKFLGKEKGAITLFLLLAMLFFLIVLFSLFISTGNKSLSHLINFYNPLHTKRTDRRKGLSVSSNLLLVKQLTEEFDRQQNPIFRRHPGLQGLVYDGDR